MKKSYKSGPRNGGIPQGIILEKKESHSDSEFNTFSLDDLNIHQKTEEDEGLLEMIMESEVIEKNEEEERPMSEAARLRAEAILSRKNRSRTSSKKRTSVKS